MYHTRNIVKDKLGAVEEKRGKYVNVLEKNDIVIKCGNLRWLIFKRRVWGWLKRMLVFASVI